ncbi:MAG: SEC-C domain-containing protein [Acidobacteria bacterium]|nr:SEC-C domain-containing protein [Acidobacteriota bacterium]
MATGRNDPCPCGSGRKYKQCCLSNNEQGEARWRAWREAESAVVTAVIEFAGDTWGEAFLKHAFEEFYAGSPDPEDPMTRGQWEQLFLPWFAFDFIPRPPKRAKQTASWPVTTLAEAYLSAHGQHVPAAEVRLLRAGIEAPLSFMVVTSAEAGKSVDLRDILLGDVHHVVERSASTSLRPGHVVLSRVIADGDLAIMSGLGPFPLFPTSHQTVINYRERFLRPGGPVTRTAVKAAAPEVLGLYHRLVHEVLHPAPLRLQNTDGDPLAPATLEFKVRCSVRDAFDRLKLLTLANDDDELLDDASWSESGELTAVDLVWSKWGNKLHREWDNTTLGNLSLSPGQLSVSVNSTKRARKIRRLVEKHLGSDVLFLRETIESVDALLEAAKHGGSPGDDASAGPSFEDTPEARAMLDEMSRRHWEAWFDEEIPALGGVTPREAAKTRLGRERLEALLAEYAWRDEAGPRNQFKPEVAWLRERLGLPGV